MTTEEIIGGMYRAHQAGQPFAALVANPQFANLPQEQKKQVLAGFRQRMGGGPSSINALTSVIKGTAGGALAGLPLGVAVPLAIELAESGATKKSVLSALKMAAQNKHVKILVGTGMTLGAVGGMLNSAMSIYQAKKDQEAMKQDLDEAAQGGEALAAASFGGIGGRSSPRTVNMEPVIKSFRDTATPYVLASARYGHYGQMIDDADTPRYEDIVAKTNEKVLRGVPMDPSRLAKIAKDLAKSQGHYDAIHSVVVNSPRELNIDPATEKDMVAHILQLHGNNAVTIGNLNTLEQYVRQVRDMKRGDQ